MKNLQHKLKHHGRITYFKQKGDPYIFATGLGLVVALAMVVAMVAIILTKGLGFFWPRQLTQVTLKSGDTYLGEIWERDSRFERTGTGQEVKIKEIQLKIGNRDLYGQDFKWIDLPDVERRQQPPLATVIERLEYGNFYGFIRAVHLEQTVVDSPQAALLQAVRKGMAESRRIEARIKTLEHRLHDLTEPLSVLDQKIAQLEASGQKDAPAVARQLAHLQQQADSLEAAIGERYDRLEQQLGSLYQARDAHYLTMETADGQQKDIPLYQIVRIFQPNRMTTVQKVQHYLAKLWEFVSANPRESNTEGGVFPAIFGTVMMVLLMSIAVVPFGVLAAIYLNEYARQGRIIRLIRLSVNNLAGVPSIVYGMFGLGFFVYLVGGSIDHLFFSNRLPEPTFGTGGILWASLTLALLTLPVVVVATEEGLLAVPRANKEGALALGATRWQMIRKIAIPNAMPGILTGLILAISRGAGEVAPLMITGVVKLAPSLPLDTTFPFLHLDRKFMHLGFHIYDVGFQSPNVEAAKPMVYLTALLLIAIVVCLNLLAIYLRNRLRKKYRSSAF
ncbi:MAG: phosphate ABC transporter permease PstA [Calditrichaeota bacterium]|nr:MAG: phosphate ABC transporter permease PstA [Calditrichota bacterium]